MLRKAKKRQYMTRRSEDHREKQRLASKTARGKALTGKNTDYVSPERLVKDYREKQKSYSIYRRTVWLFI